MEGQYRKYGIGSFDFIFSSLSSTSSDPSVPGETGQRSRPWSFYRDMLAQGRDSLFQGFQSLSNTATVHGGHGWSWEILGGHTLNQ